MSDLHTQLKTQITVSACHSNKCNKQRIMNGPLVIDYWIAWYIYFFSFLLLLFYYFFFAWVSLFYPPYGCK